MDDKEKAASVDINKLLVRAKAAEKRAEKAEKKLAEAIQDMSGICYLCANSKPFKMGHVTMRSCDHLNHLAANKNPGCEHFLWKGQEDIPCN